MALRWRFDGGLEITAGHNTWRSGSDGSGGDGPGLDGSLWSSFGDHYNLKFDDEEDPIVVFDLEMEEFRRLRLPFPKVEGDDSRYGSLVASGSVDFWVMERYGDNDSWNMLYSFRISNESPIKFLKPLVVAESSQVLVRCSTAAELELVRIRGQEEEKCGTYMNEAEQMLLKVWKIENWIDRGRRLRQ
ncbi:uncharacterized protein LOC112194286 [Rosa chinensis]|uniref:uncharacterized protein LOC112194286 n=1 Tax=Rosa chinensis TaxID=74649 RepID=UPI000D09492E|nr:uncharacterized protein LOC112194286 [Rosa chinensis]